MRSFLIVLLVVPILYANGQTDIDSLYTLLQISDPGTEENVNLQIKVARELSESVPDSASFYLSDAEETILKEGFDSIMSQLLIVKSIINSYQANYEVAIAQSFSALEVALKYRDTITIMDAYNNLGIDFSYQENNAEAIKYFKETEALAEEFGDSVRWGHALNNLGMMVGYEGNYNQELEYYTNAARIFKMIRDREGYANSLMNSGSTLTQLKRFNEAESNYVMALNIYQELGYYSAIQQTLQSMSENNLVRGRILTALQQAREALKLAEAYQFEIERVYTYDLLRNIHIKMENIDSAYYYQGEHFRLKEEIFNKEKSRQITEMQARYETEKQKEQIELLTTQNELTELKLFRKRREQLALISGSAILLVIGSVLIFLFVNRSKLQKKLLEEEIDNLRLKINSLVGNEEGSLIIDKDTLDKGLVNPLSEREFEILSLAISEKNNHEIAEETFISVNTVKYHLKNIYEKLGVTNRREALQAIINRS